MWSNIWYVSIVTAAYLAAEARTEDILRDFTVEGDTRDPRIAEKETIKVTDEEPAKTSDEPLTKEELAAATLAKKFPCVEVHENKGCAEGKFMGRAYQAQSASDKLEQLWAKILEIPTVSAHDWAATPDFFTKDMNAVFDWEGDERGYRSSKVNHSQGVAALVDWKDLGGHDYTGIYKTGSSRAIMRMSEAGFPVPESDGLTPSLAIKFLRDGMHSVNHVANTDWAPSGSWNFFANDFRNHIGPFMGACEQQTIQRKFEEATNFVGSVGLAEFARVNVDGTEVRQVQFPANLKFVPTEEVKAMFPDEGEFDKDGNMIPHYTQLLDMPERMHLFEVWTQKDPNPCDGSVEMTWQHIANIWSKSKWTNSEFCDKCLFFKHEKMNLDFSLRKELSFALRCKYENIDPWMCDRVPRFPTDQTTAEAWIRGQIHDQECPFAWLLNLPFTPIF